jgi:hypothetical protein
MRRQLKADVTLDGLSQLKERKINQVRLKKLERTKKIKSLERHQANKWFDRNEAKFYEHCRSIINSDPNNTRPVYFKPKKAPQADQLSNLSMHAFEQFWRPMWENTSQEILDTPWIKEIRSSLQSRAPTPSSENLTITAEIDTA